VSNPDINRRTKTSFSLSRKLALSILCAFALLLTWFCWPIYGFLSNQFEVARLPWGWHYLPSEMPQDELVENPAFTEAGKIAMELLATHRGKIKAPSISAAIAVQGQLVWAGAIGWADVENQLPVKTKTAYRIGSTSKAVGITGLARLVSAGVMDLDAIIATYSGSLPNAAWEKFTSRQLASHTAGLAAYEENNDWRGFYQSLALTTRFDSPDKALSVFDGADLLFEPGEKFHYSGFDNVLLSAVMQDAAAMPFDKVMAQYVFEPLKLSATLPDHLRSNEILFAHSYQTKGNKVKLWRNVDLSHKVAAGGYVSTPSELVTLGAAWLNDNFIKTDVRDTFWMPVRLPNGEVNDNDYALGFRRKSLAIDGVGDIIHLNHGGISKGAQCWLMIVPKHNIVLAISINRRTDEFSDFARVSVDLLKVFIDAQAKYQ